jgi:hypothetical protein
VDLTVWCINIEMQILSPAGTALHTWLSQVDTALASRATIRRSVSKGMSQGCGRTGVCDMLRKTASGSASRVSSITDVTDTDTDTDIYLIECRHERQCEPRSQEKGLSRDPK